MIEKNGKEQWKVINDFPSYAISSFGRVKRIKPSENLRWKTGGIINPSRDEKGYLRVSLRKNNKPFLRRIHVLVSNAFLEKNQGENCRHHKDGNKNNNLPSNLSFISVTHHRLIHPSNSFPNGSKHPNSKLTEDDVRSIKIFIQENIFLYQIAIMFNVTQTCISKIKRGLTWKHLET